VQATKFGLPVGGDPNRQGGSPSWITRAVDASLRRLGTDYIDLYQLHRPDYSTDLDETLGAPSDLIRAGKVRAIGSSTFPADLVVEAQWVAERRGHHRFRTEQPRYSILTRTIESTVLPVAQRHGMGVLSYGPLSSGWLSGRADPTRGHRTTTAPQAFDLNVPANRAKLEAVHALSELAAEAGLPLTHLATAFVRSHPAVISVIIGPRTSAVAEGDRPHFPCEPPRRKTRAYWELADYSLTQTGKFVLSRPHGTKCRSAQPSPAFGRPRRNRSTEHSGARSIGQCKPDCVPR
jgi:aryl-alcohol dehydrogenase-like predicted oxidoreductase